MHSPLHPKGFVLAGMARLACRLLNLSVSAEQPAVSDTLAHLASHPVHLAIADEIGVLPETAFRPSTPRTASPGHMTMADFLAASFAFYATVPRAELYAANGITGALQALGFGVA